MQGTLQSYEVPESLSNGELYCSPLLWVLAQPNPQILPMHDTAVLPGEHRVAPGVLSISKLWFWGHAERNTEKQWRTSEWNLNDIHNDAWPY